MNTREFATPSNHRSSGRTVNAEPMSDAQRTTERGFTILETVVVVGIIGVLGAIAAPMFGNAMKNFRISGDARNASNGIALAKMRAASVFGRVRLFVDVSDRSFYLQTFDKVTSTWGDNTGRTYLSQGVNFGYGVVGSAPSGTQSTIGQAALCKNDAGIAIANTACVIFNSRGLPIDSTGSPPAEVYALYVTDATVVYGVTVSQTGMVRGWRTAPAATPTWVLH